MDERELLIDDIINRFNFEKVYVAMTALDWQWITTTGEGHAIPSITRLKGMARHLLREAIKCHVAGSGGFVAKYQPKVDHESESFTLEFILCSCESYDD